VSGKDEVLMDLKEAFSVAGAVVLSIAAAAGGVALLLLYPPAYAAASVIAALLVAREALRRDAGARVRFTGFMVAAASLCALLPALSFSLLPAAALLSVALAFTALAAARKEPDLSGGVGKAILGGAMLGFIGLYPSAALAFILFARSYPVRGGALKRAPPPDWREVRDHG